MKQFEKDLKKVIAVTDNGCEPVFSSALNIPESRLRILKSKKLIRMQPAGDNYFMITVLDVGLTYFDNKCESQLQFIKENLAALGVTFFGGFASGILVTLLAQLLLT